jgi:hypothetical protein
MGLGSHQLMLLKLARLNHLLSWCCTEQVQGPEVQLQAQAAAVDRPVPMHGRSECVGQVLDGSQGARVSGTVALLCPWPRQAHPLQAADAQCQPAPALLTTGRRRVLLASAAGQPPGYRQAQSQP